ncbi:MAG TPA: hypothetical protein VJU77_06685 [Chthoniobacterales bacterium]|nr:hypothetical protein [Chthoniobacterales bacterium]
MNTRKTLLFGHDGVHAGYEASMKAYAHLGKGAVIMLNKNHPASTKAAIFGVIAKKYDWPDYPIAGK